MRAVPVTGYPVIRSSIADAMVRDAPRIDAALPAFLEFARGAVLVAQGPNGFQEAGLGLGERGGGTVAAVREMLAPQGPLPGPDRLAQPYVLEVVGAARGLGDLGSERRQFLLAPLDAFRQPDDGPVGLELRKRPVQQLT